MARRCHRRMSMVSSWRSMVLIRPPTMRSRRCSRLSRRRLSRLISTTIGPVVRRTSVLLPSPNAGPPRVMTGGYWPAVMLAAIPGVGAAFGSRPTGAVAHPAATASMTATAIRESHRRCILLTAISFGMRPRISSKPCWNSGPPYNLRAAEVRTRRKVPVFGSRLLPGGIPCS